MYPKLPSSTSTHQPSSTNPFNGTVSRGDDDKTTLLPIVPVLKEVNSRTGSGYGLLDPGSQISNHQHTRKRIEVEGLKDKIENRNVTWL